MVVSSIIMKFNEKIKNVRKNANLSQKQLAYIAGVDVRSYQRYESGERIPNQITLTNICTTLPRYTDYLISVSNLDFDKYLNIITIDFLDISVYYIYRFFSIYQAYRYYVLISMTGSSCIGSYYRGS